jgi:hypothetical protein
MTCPQVGYQHILIINLVYHRLSYQAAENL